MPIIPVTWEVAIGEPQLQAGPRQKHEPLPEKQNKPKGPQVWLRKQSACLASTGSEFPNPCATPGKTLRRQRRPPSSFPAQQLSLRFYGLSSPCSLFFCCPIFPNCSPHFSCSNLMRKLAQAFSSPLPGWKMAATHLNCVPGTLHTQSYTIPPSSVTGTVLIPFYRQNTTVRSGKSLFPGLTARKATTRVWTHLGLAPEPMVLNSTPHCIPTAC